MPRAPRRAPTQRASRFCCWTRIARSGISSRSAAGCARSARARELGGARRLLRAAGGDRRLPRRARDGRGHRLAAHRRALCATGAAGALADHRAQPRGRGRHGRGPAGRASTAGRRRRRAGAEAYHHLPAFAATCCKSSAGSRRRGRRSKPPRTCGQRARTRADGAPRRGARR